MTTDTERKALVELVAAAKYLQSRVVETRGVKCMDVLDIALDKADRALATPPVEAAMERDAAIAKAATAWWDEEVKRYGVQLQAPGHAHSRYGIWDDDNGEFAGKPCARCSLWAQLGAALTAQHKEVTNG